MGLVSLQAAVTGEAWLTAEKDGKEMATEIDSDSTWLVALMMEMRDFYLS